MTSHISLAFALLLCACSPVTAADEATTVEVEPDLPAIERPADTTFEEVLGEYQALNDRLERVAAPLRIANAELCADRFRDPGFSTHRLTDYPEGLRPIAQALLGLSPDGLHIRSVRAGTSAEAARLEPGDRLLAVNEQRISSDPTMSRYNRAVLDNGFASTRPELTLRTPQGREFSIRVRPDTACQAPTRVVFSDEINGHTDGEDVLITSGLMRAVPDDTNLALVVAHEMAHMMAGHFEQTPSQALELEADRMALVLMARAGYDVEGAVAYWDEAQHPHEGGSEAESSHPTTHARYENFRRELARIQRVEDFSTLGFN